MQPGSISDWSRFALRKCSHSFRSISDSFRSRVQHYSHRFWLRSISDQSMTALVWTAPKSATFLVRDWLTNVAVRAFDNSEWDSSECESRSQGENVASGWDLKLSRSKVNVSVILEANAIASETKSWTPCIGPDRPTTACIYSRCKNFENIGKTVMCLNFHPRK